MPERTVSTRPGISRDSMTITIPRTSGEISTRSPISRDASGRGIVIGRDMPSREPTVFETTELNRRIAGYVGSKSLQDFLGGKPSSNIQANDSTGDINLPIYGMDNPFNILGDAFMRAFGGQTYSPPRESERTVIESAGSSNTGIILVVLAAVGFGVYWFYFRKN